MTEPKTTALEMVNASVRFGLELAALGIVGYWGYSIGQTDAVKLGLGVSLPLVVVAVWGVFGSPAAPYRLEYPWRLGLEVLILGGAAIALYLLDRPVLAAEFVAIATLNTILLYILGQT